VSDSQCREVARSTWPFRYSLYVSCNNNRADKQQVVRTLLDWKLEWDEHTNNYLFIVTQCYLLTIGLDDDVNMALVCFVDCGFDTVYVVN